MPTLYRAEPYTDGLHEAQRPRDSVRLPSNVPYVVDNLWEYLRPSHMPCRRHAVYASPTRALARANKMGRDKGDGFCVYKLVVDGPFAMAQLLVKDAKCHGDIKRIAALVQQKSAELLALTGEARLIAGLLFMPGVTAKEWAHLRAVSPFADAFIAEACALSKFWQEATPQPNGSEGELFLQLSNASYRAVNLKRFA